ncbi:ComEA family DNA-binding protein [Paenibacillus segetis]|nr:helix-hairpin-helix domain-containing protein [Paenibacillus segetis]
MKKEYMLISAVSAIIGAGLMFAAIGGNSDPGIEGWVPVNKEVVAAMQTNVDSAQIQSGTEVSNTTMSVADANKPEVTGTTSPSSGEIGLVEPEKVASPSPEPQQQQSQSGLININTAGLMELQNIPGIGAKKAQAIVDYRNAHGAFTSVDDLTKVKGIGDKMLQKMKPHIGL